MSTITDIYNLVQLSEGDVWYPGNDQQNMQTVENQLADLTAFVGPGVLTGWAVTSMSLTGTTALDSSILQARATLAAAYALSPYSALGVQYANIGVPTTESDWNQVIAVNEGTGIVGLFAAHTNTPVYFRLSQPNVYYIWAESSPCLTTEGTAIITCPLQPDLNHDQYATATYLATITVAQTTPTSGVYYVEMITYEDKRQELIDLAGQLQTALKTSFYRHVHLGGDNHPSKINLSTRLLLNASGPVGSTIFLVMNLGNVFTWNPASYGVPQVILNNLVLPTSSYNLSAFSGRLYLKNSLGIGAVLQVSLPLSPQVALTVQQGSSITAYPVLLTNGQLISSQDSDGNTVNVQRVYTWDAGQYLAPQVYLKGNLINPAGYTLNPNAGSLNWTPPLTGSFLNSDLSVVITHIGKQVQNFLDGKRVVNIDASTFATGVLDKSRIAGLDHVGQSRYMNAASLRPYLRLFSEGNHQTFYPELTTTALQYGTEVYSIYQSSNIAAAPILVGTKRGMMQMTDGTDAQYFPGWDTDLGRPVKFIDNLLCDGTNHFRETYCLTAEGAVYYTNNGGISWAPLRLPILAETVPFVTAFGVRTDKQEVYGNILTTYHWYKDFYLGTDQGLFYVSILEGESNTDWTWSVVAPPASTGISKSWGTINDVMEVVTLHYSYNSDLDSSTNNYETTLYVATSSGLYVNGTQVFAGNVDGLFWIRSGPSLNNLFWWASGTVYGTQTARHTITNDGTHYDDFWVHPLTTPPIPPLNYASEYQAVFQDAGRKFLGMAAYTGLSEYLALSNFGPVLLTDTVSTQKALQPTTAALIPWDTERQKSATTAIVLASGIKGVILIGGPRGLWKSVDGGSTWVRATNQFAQSTTPTIYDSKTGAIIARYTMNAFAQSFDFFEPQPLWENLIYERDYVNYYVAPWVDSGAQVIVYINAQPSNIPYGLNSALGQITFTQGLQPSDTVQITIVRLGAYISNVGATPHGELSNVFVTGQTALTTLAADFAPTDRTITVSDPSAIPVSANYLQLVSSGHTEQVAIFVNPTTLAITLPRPRVSTFTFPKQYTQVFLVVIENISGIEDKISQTQTAQTYHMNSVGGQNVLQLTVAARTNETGLFTYFTGTQNANYVSQTDRGPKKALFFNFVTDNPDVVASSSTVYVGLEPTLADNPARPHTIYATYNATVGGTNLVVGTDEGVWNLL